MDKKELQKIISAGEDSIRQFKIDVKNVDSFAAEMVALSNSEGGRIFIGVNDKGVLKGLTSKDVSRINQLISNAASQHIRSPISPITENVSIAKSKVIIVVTIPEGIDKPYFDRNGVIWLKSGADKRRIQSKDELRRMFQEGGSFHADEIPTKASFEDVDKQRFKDFFSQIYKSKLPTKKADLVRLFENLDLAKRGKLNLAGLLLFGGKPQLYKPLFHIKAVAFPGTSIAAREYLDSEDFNGTLQQQFEGAISFIMRNLRKEQQGQNVNSIGIPEIPRFVFEELIVNALIHRDYLVNGSIRILVFTDRIEIISPGTLPDSLTVEAIKLGVSVPRNPIIISFISKGILPYRGLGSGIRRALEGTANIDFSSNQETLSFTATIWRERITDKETGLKGTVRPESGQSQARVRPESDVIQRILSGLAMNPLSRSEIAQLLGHRGVSSSLKNAIKKLLAEKMIEYTIPEKPNSRLQKYRLVTLKKGNNKNKNNE